jgi:uncharacterized repeat protein (TIGR03833 family)
MIQHRGGKTILLQHKLLTLSVLSTSQYLAKYQPSRFQARNQRLADPMPPSGVPKTHEVIPGAHVNIVLKADQPTGRQERGIVRDVLTKGNHPRGIKVRLTDGRIGRVQSTVARGVGGDSTTLQPPSSTASMMPATPGTATSPQSQRGWPRYRDVRLDEPLNAAPEQIDLGAYIVPSRRKGQGRKGASISQSDDVGSALDSGASTSHNDSAPVATSATATCPVCGEFEGDESAVAHHVDEHFGP